MIAPELLAKRPKTYCRECGGAFRTLGMESVWVPHEPGCSRDPFNRKQDDREAEALRHLGAPFPVHDIDCPHCSELHKEPRTYYPARSWWEQDVDLGGAR